MIESELKIQEEKKETGEINPVIPKNSVILGKDPNGNIIYQLGRFVISYLALSDNEIEKIEEQNEEKSEKTGSNN